MDRAPNLCVQLPHRRSTTISLETQEYPLNSPVFSVVCLTACKFKRRNSFHPLKILKQYKIVLSFLPESSVSHKPRSSLTLIKIEPKPINTDQHEKPSWRKMFSNRRIRIRSSGKSRRQPRKGRELRYTWNIAKKVSQVTSQQREN